MSDLCASPEAFIPWLDSVLPGFINEMDSNCELLRYKKQRKACVLV